MRPHRPSILIVLTATTLLSGCGFVITQGPPPGHETMSTFDCTTSNLGPILDAVEATGAGLYAVDASNNPQNYKTNGQRGSPALVYAVLSAAWGWSAVSGFNKTSKCAEAKRLLAGRYQDAISHAGPRPVVVAVRVTPAIDTLALGSTVQLTAEARASSGALVTSAAFTWVSSDPTIATVDVAGLVLARSPGTVTIMARTDSVVGTMRVVVR